MDVGKAVTREKRVDKTSWTRSSSLPKRHKEIKGETDEGVCPVAASNTSTGGIYSFVALGGPKE